MRHTALRLGICFLPLAITPVLGFLIADGYLNFGGGEKDLLILIPWLIWTLIYLLIFVISWIKRVSIKRGLTYSAGGATGVLGIIWLATYLWSSGLLGLS